MKVTKSIYAYAIVLMTLVTSCSDSGGGGDKRPPLNQIPGPDPEVPGSSVDDPKEHNGICARLRTEGVITRSITATDASTSTTISITEGKGPPLVVECPDSQISQ